MYGPGYACTASPSTGTPATAGCARPTRSSSRSGNTLIPPLNFALRLLPVPFCIALVRVLAVRRAAKGSTVVVFTPFPPELRLLQLQAQRSEESRVGTEW